MKRISFFLLALTVSGTFIGCSKDKDEDSATPAKTKAELLTAHDWIIKGATFTINGQTADGFSLYDDCEKDNFYRFTASNNTYTLNENTDVCAPSMAENGTWSLNADGTKLTLTPQGGTAEVRDIVELTDTSLKASGTGDFLGTTVTITETYGVK